MIGNMANESEGKENDLLLLLVRQTSCLGLLASKEGPFKLTRYENPHAESLV